MSIDPQKVWFEVPESHPKTYKISRVTVKRTDRALNPDGPATPGEIVEFLHEMHAGKTLDYIDTRYLLAGIVQDVDTTKEDDSNRIALPSGYYVHTKTDYNEFLLAHDLRVDKAVHLGEVQDTLENDLEIFLKNRAIFDELGCQYKRGYLLYGPPGTGKTTLIRQIIKGLMLKNKAISVALSALPSNKMLDVLREDPRLKVFVFEEMTEAVKYNPSKLLNFLDGENSVENSVTIATTNYSGALPANLVERPGRFDIVLRVADPDPNVRRELLEYWLGKPPSQESVQATEGLSTAAMREAALQSRLKNSSITAEVEILRVRMRLAEDDFGDRTKEEMGF